MRYDDDGICIVAGLYDSGPVLNSAPPIRHDQSLLSDDWLVIMLGPFNTKREGYRFETYLNSVRHDALYQDLNSFQLDWNTIQETATSVDNNSGIAEIEILFKSLPIDPEIDIWGFNFVRGIPRFV